MSASVSLADLAYDFNEQTLDVLFWMGDNIPGGLFIYHTEEPYDLVYANHAVRGIYGCATLEEFKELTGFTFRGMVHPDDFDAIQSSIEQQIAVDTDGKQDYVEYRIVRKDGEERWVDDYGHIAHLPTYGDVFYVFITDVTEKRRAQEEQRRAEMALAEERHAHEVKSSFLFSLSHDIRTPMNAVIGYSRLAKQHMDEPAHLADYLDKTIASGDQLLNLIDDMLEMNRINSNLVQLKHERTNLRELLTSVIDLFRIEVDRSDLTLVEDYNLGAREVLVDRDSLRRVVSNVVSNAVKFTPAGGTVRIAAGQELDEAAGIAHCRIVVEDTGVGMSEQFMLRMFDAFEREDSSTSTGLTGTGLGLSIAKNLIDRMGGRIEAQSTKGAGTTITIELPLRLAEQTSQPARNECETEELRAAGSWRVLVVEDIELNLMLVEEVLKEAGFIVEEAVNGREAVQAVESQPAWHYDLVLMDIQMPVMNGYEATEAIRALPREDASLLPIVALSANARVEDRERSKACGMNDHLAKPFDTEELIRTINSYVAAYHAQQASHHRAARS